tara:strand:+ start:10408 stop:10803 length:396 start_codon:yes stop_codon:yes gene_type:complete
MFKLYALTALVFFAVDLLWLGVVAKGFYQEYLGHLMRPDVIWGAALLFYSIFIAGVLVFSVLPGLETQSLGYSIALGAFLGLVTYATFDLTCLAMLKDFPVVVVYVDLAWGIALTAGVSASGYGFGRWLGL